MDRTGGKRLAGDRHAKEGERHTPVFESPAPTAAGKRLMERTAQAWIGRARNGVAPNGAESGLGDWQAPRFEPAAPTAAEVAQGQESQGWDGRAPERLDPAGTGQARHGTGRMVVAAVRLRCRPRRAKLAQGLAMLGRAATGLDWNVTARQGGARRGVRDERMVAGGVRLPARSRRRKSLRAWTAMARLRTARRAPDRIAEARQAGWETGRHLGSSPKLPRSLRRLSGWEWHYRHGPGIARLAEAPRGKRFGGWSHPGSTPGRRRRVSAQGGDWRAVESNGHEGRG